MDEAGNFGCVAFLSAGIQPLESPQAHVLLCGHHGVHLMLAGLGKQITKIGTK